MTTSSFNCSFSDLSDTARLGWFSYHLYLDRFAAHKASKYTQALADDNLARINAFLVMDDYQAHVALIQNARDSFVNEIKGINTLFKLLKNYGAELTDDKEKRKTLFKDAGQQLYDKLRTNHWEDYDGLLNTMIRFVQSNQADLLAKDLPASFLTQLQDKRAKLAATYNVWRDEDAAGSAATEAKNIAGNTIKANLSAMFAEAQVIFQEEKEIAKKFVWDIYLAEVQGPRDAGVGGKILLKDTKKGVEKVTVSIPSLNMSIVTDADGRYELSPVPPDTYDIEVTGVGIQKQVIKDRVIKQGVIGRLTIEVEAVV